MTDLWDTLLTQEPAWARLFEPLRPVAVSLALEKGERLFSIGDIPRRMCFVLEGEVRLVRASGAGGEAILQRSRRGFLAEASLESPAYHCDAVAASPSKVLAFPIPRFRRLLDDDAALRAGWTTHLAREVRRLRAACERLSLKGAAARILHYLETEGRNDEGVRIPSRKAWAAELGLTHEALYRTLAQLRDRGVIRLDGEQIALIQ